MSYDGDAYGAGYGYGSYGYGGYAYAYSAYDGGFGPALDAGSLLNGPGSSAYVRGPHSGSFAYEGQNSSVYVSEFSFERDEFASSTSYTYSGPDGSVRRSSSYEDYSVKTPGGYHSPYASYYGGYPSPYGSIVSNGRSDDVTTTYTGSITDRVSISDQVITFDSGYSENNYGRQTSESEGGHTIPGSGYGYFVQTITDPYGYTSHTSTF